MRFPSFLGANLLLVQCYSMLLAAVVYGNGMYVLYSWVGPVILGAAESAVLWLYCYLPMNHVEERLSMLHFWI